MTSEKGTAGEETRSYHQPGVLRVLQTKAETRAFYDKIAKVYDLLSEHSEGPIRRKGLAMLDARPGETVLEIGFGTGHSLADLAEAVGPEGRVLGIDISPEMEAVARKRLAERGLEQRAELRTGDAASLPYDEASIDAVFMSFTLELFDTPEIFTVLAECRRVLRPGGRIVVIGMSRVRGNGLIMDIFEWTHRHFPNYLDCRPILVRQAVQDAGFHVQGATIEKMWIQVEIVLATAQAG